MHKKIFLYRKVAHYMITYYLPSSLFVVVSWASFLIPSDDIQVGADYDLLIWP